MVKQALYLIFICGCINNVETEKESSEDVDSGSGDIQEASDDTESNDGESPEILSADAWCYRIDVGGIVETWKFVATATDPQGVETLANYIPGAATFLNSDGSEIDAISLICSDGDCSTTVNSTALGATCSDVDNHKVRFFVQDQDGNQSSYKTIDTRLGIDENG